MPSFSLLKRSSRKEVNGNLSDATSGEVSSHQSAVSIPTTSDGLSSSNSTSEGSREQKKARRHSRRDILHDFIQRSIRGTPGAGAGAGTGPGGRSTPQRASIPESTASPPLRSTDSPVSPRSPVNPNKPLPSPPPPGSENDIGPPAKPVLKLARIMSTLTDEDLEKLFSGAPQYFARSEGHFTGAPHPSVAFPWDESLEIRDLTDHTQIEDEAWGGVTAWPHLIRRESSHRRKSIADSRKRAHFYPRCRERPSMLSMQGLEKGTVGYQAALEMAVGDALQEEQFGFDSMGHKANAVIEARRRLLTSKLGLRHLEEDAIMEGLLKNGARYGNNNMKDSRASTKFYNELFLGILHPPTRVLDHYDPYSLSVQIQALLKVLAMPNVWIDFSHVEWRIRLGQILWAAETEDDVHDGASIQMSGTADERQEERYWLLLQILLGTELLIRLDAITEGDELGTESISPSEVHRFEKDANTSVKWTLILARAWLENIEITKSEPAGSDQAAQNHSGWLATLTKRISLSAEGGHLPHSHHHSQQKKHMVYAMKGRHSQRQVDGLTHFARRLRWPGIEGYAKVISDNCRAVTEGTPLSTPLTTPAPGGTPRSSYFGGDGIPTVNIKRQPSRQRKVAAGLNPSGWLSRSFISGFMLPGEGMYHFLMATLLENDKEAMSTLGPMANLCGGFVYRGKSFWSTACIVGRVLAAGKGSAECMGWISSDITPQGIADSWVNVEVEELRDEVININKRARLWGKANIEKSSSILGEADPASVLPADFIIPHENNYGDSPPPNLSIVLKSLNLFAPVDSVHTTPTEENTPAPTPFSEVSKIPEIHTYPAAISFSVTEEDEFEGTEYTLALSHDIHFVTAHPCVPSKHVKIMKSPSSPTIQQIDVSDSGMTPHQSSPAAITGHPLHKSYTYAAMHLSDLLEKEAWTLEQHLNNYRSSSHRPSLTPATTDTTPKVLVIDCITGFTPQPLAHEVPLSPVVSRSSSEMSPLSPVSSREEAAQSMHHETRRRQFGSDVEILIRAFCAEKGWNALISRRRRGCLSCAIREAGALGWKVVVRVD